MAADERIGADALATHMLASGHRNIAFIDGKPESRATAETEARWRQAMNAAGIMNAAYERGLRLPHDLSVAGYDDLDLSRKRWPNLTTVQHPIERLGEIAARQLVAWLQPLRVTGDLPAAQVLPSCDLVVRISVVPITI